MYKVTCYDKDNNTINSLTQWDLGQVIYFKDLTIESPLIAHFHNKMLNKNEAVSVIVTVSKDNIISVEVPNFLLQQAYPINVYLYQESSESGKTVYTTTIPVKAKAKPSTYKYIENISSMSLVTFLDDIEKSINDSKNDISTATNNAINALNEIAQEIANGVADGSPKGSFADASELIEKDSGIYVNSVDGYVYYWNGEIISEPIVLYQATKIADGSIVESMVSEDFAYKAFEDKRKFDSISLLDEYINSQYAQAGQVVRVLENVNGNDVYQMYLLQIGTNGNLEKKKINSDEEALKLLEQTVAQLSKQLSTEVDNSKKAHEELLNDIKEITAGDLSWNDASRTLQLLNIANGKNIGNSVVIPMGITGLQLGIEIDDADETKTYLVLSDADGTELARTQIPSGGGSTTDYIVMKLRNLLDSTAFTVPYNGTSCVCNIKYSFTSVYSDGTGDTGNGTAYYYVNGDLVFITQNLTQGTHEIDMGCYLTPNKINTVKVTVIDNDNNKKTLTYNVNVAYNYLVSEFPQLSTQRSNFTIPYTPNGTGNKTIYCVIDGEEYEKINTQSSSSVMYFDINGLTHGGHTIEIYMDTLLDGYSEPIPSNVLSFGVMYIEDNADDNILYIKSNETLVEQYTYIITDFAAYDKNVSKCNINVKVEKQKTNGEYESIYENILSVDSGSVSNWSYRVTETGQHRITFTYNNINKYIEFNVLEVSVAKAENSGLKFLFDPINRSNNEPNDVKDKYSFTNSANETYDVDFTNIDFKTYGWTGNSLRIPLNGLMTIPYAPFATDVDETKGKTIEMSFKIKNVYDYEQNVINCYANNKGIQVTSNKGSLNVNASDSVSVQYNDDTEVRLSFVIAKRNTENNNRGQLIYVFVNSDIAGVIKYSELDSFLQNPAANITIGSAYAEIEVYKIRCYDIELFQVTNTNRSYQILNNYIADSPDVNDMLERNARNDIFDDSYTVDYNKLPDNCPYLVIECLELPQYKGDKKTGVSGRFVDNGNPESSFIYEGAEIDVQGTSSADYYVKNFKIGFKNGIQQEKEVYDEETEQTTTEIINSPTYQLYNNSIPTSTFCLKADVASSEGANNTVLMKVWDDITRWLADDYETLTPSQINNENIRQTIDSKPIVVYWKNPADGSLKFWGKYNFNNDKGTPEVFGLQKDDNNTCQSWEFKDNGLVLCEFKSDDFETEVSVTDKDTGETKLIPRWQTSFEARFPKDFDDITALKQVVSWVSSTNTLTATNENLPSAVVYDEVSYVTDTAEYRLAKFKNEFENYFKKDLTLLYYIFTDIFLMVDSRAKNQFITTFDKQHWFFLPYDGDTALGIDNIGALNFGYWLEDTSQYNGTNVYNGQDSVLWNNVRAVFQADIKALCSDLVSKGFNYNYVRERFNQHQSAWSEALFCADTECKYIKPYFETGTVAYLGMAQGSKKLQRDFWLKNRFNYWCSKYQIGSAVNTTNIIQMRMSTPQGTTSVTPSNKVNITPFTNTYLIVSFGQTRQSQRCDANKTVEFVSTLDSNGDSVLDIYNGSEIKSLGDLSACYIKRFELGSEAVNLESIILGSDVEGYVNEGLTADTFSLGNSQKLKTINVSNCVNLGGNINISNCYNIQEILAKGTKISSVSLPESSQLKVLKLPNTISNLTLINQTYLETFDIEGYDYLTSITIQNTPIDILDIINNAPILNNINLIDINWNLDNCDLLNSLIEKNNLSTCVVKLSGKIHIPEIRTQDLDLYQAAWGNDLIITYDHLIKQFPVTFEDYDGTVLGVVYVVEGNAINDCITIDADNNYSLKDGTLLFNKPIRDFTWDKVYNFRGWNGNLTSSIREAVTYKATYTEIARKYTVEFMSDGKTLYSVEGTAGESVTYDIERGLPSKEKMGSTWYLCKGWTDTGYEIYTGVVDSSRIFSLYNPLELNEFLLSEFVANIPTVIQPTLVINAIFDECSLPANLPFNPTEDDVREYVEQYDYVYTNDSSYSSAYTLPELYAICMSDDFALYLAEGDKARIKLDKNTSIGGDIINSGHDIMIMEVLGFNVYERQDSNFGDYEGDILGVFPSIDTGASDLVDKDMGLYLCESNGSVYYWNGTSLSSQVTQYFSHVVWGMALGDNLANNAAGKQYGHIMDTTQQMNTSNTTKNGWGNDEENTKCKMNQWLNDGIEGLNGGDSIFSYLPSDLQSIITPVKVMSSKGAYYPPDSTTAEFSIAPVLSVCKLFIPSYAENWSATSVPYLNEINKWASLCERDENNNVIKINKYPKIVSNNTLIRRKYLGTGTEALGVWTRSPCSVTNFCNVNTNGTFYNHNGIALTSDGVPLCFCVG